MWFPGPGPGRQVCLLPVRAQVCVGALASSCHMAAPTPALNLAMQHADPWSKAVRASVGVGLSDWLKETQR